MPEASSDTSAKCAVPSIRERRQGDIRLKDKVLAVVLFLSGLSMNATASTVGVSEKTVYMWITEFYHKYAEMPVPTDEVKGMDFDEMYHYLSKKTKVLDLESYLS